MADFDDIVAVSGRLDVDTIVQAYSAGIFPWPMDGMRLVPWFCPKQRAILDFNDLHVPRSLERARRRLGFYFTVDNDFDQVIESCAAAPRLEGGTWITPELMAAYKALHRASYGHSVEAWTDPSCRELVGGIYGVAVHGYFSAESMFYKRPYASKLALLHLIEHLRARGLTWMDIQVLTPHMEQMGAKLISRDQFLSRLAQEPERPLFDGRTENK